MKKLALLMLVLVMCMSLVPTVALGQDEAVSPIPGAECTPDVEPEGDPIVVGGTLALTGPFAATGNIHRVVGELFVDWVNECGGVLGRPVEWDLRDDASDAAQAATLYADLAANSDVVIGPYAAASILAAAGPVEQAGKIYVTHTNGAPDQEIGDFHFPSWQISGEDPTAPYLTASTIVFDALESAEEQPETIFFMAAQFPTTLSLTENARTVAAERGYEEIDFVTYEIGTGDFSSVALRIQAEDPDFIFVGGIALDAVNLFDAFEAIGYIPRGIYVALPAPGPTMGLGEVAEGLMSLTVFEAHEPFTTDPTAAEFVERYQAVATDEGVLPIVETQAAASFSAWQILFASIVATESLDNADLKEYLLANTVPVIAGEASFDGFNGYGTDFSRVVQIQEGERVIVWPPDFAAPDASVEYPIE